jgi:protein O-mannosyl-transferase
MISAALKTRFEWLRRPGWWLLWAGVVLCAAIYWPGLSGGYLFDDYPNIVENTAVHPTNWTLPSLINAALSSPSSEFKRPLASLTFAANYLLTGSAPYGMKLTNLIFHLLNGLLAFLLARALILLAGAQAQENKKRAEINAALIACGWMLLPINLTGVLYLVQRMESLANLFVLVGLIGYVAGRRRMQLDTLTRTDAFTWKGYTLCIVSITIPAALGALAKETAVMLPLYAFLIEWLLLGFRTLTPFDIANGANSGRRDNRIVILFLIVLALPTIVGLAWLIPWLLNPNTWATRDFTLGTRLLSESRIVVDYIAWTIIPAPQDLSFYHDDFIISTGIFSPWTTLASIIFLTALIALAVGIRRRYPLVSLGIAFFIGSHLLTATILPLELIYEHRNYFPSFGLMLAVVPMLLPSASRHTSHRHSFALARKVLLGGLLLLWGSETAMSALAWENPLELAQTLANRAPDSPRAQYELGRMYIVYSNYDPKSEFTRLAYAPLERAAAIPSSSILPEQALIFMNSRMRLPVKDIWWDSLIAKLKKRNPGVQDESSLAALTDCDRDGQCDLPLDRLEQAYLAALSHPNPSARLLAMYSSFAWNLMKDQKLGLRMAKKTVQLAPNEPAYRITLIRMLLASNQRDQARKQIEDLKRLNLGGRLDADLIELQR